MPEDGARPRVTIVHVVYNRRDALRECLQRMLFKSDYADRTDVIVVDNASQDGSAAMVREEFPQVRVIERATNIGAPAWNDGFAVATGDYVLILDDDCYLPVDGLRRAVEAATAQEADLVSFAVRSSVDRDYRFDMRYRTGLLSFWGCAWLVRRNALEVLGGYDPELFIWANELEFMLRFFDRGYRHLHMPEVEAIHMKVPPPYEQYLRSPGYSRNARHFAYIAAKLLRPRDAIEAFFALLGLVVRDGLRTESAALRAIWPTLMGYAHGLRLRQPVRNAKVSRAYRQNFHSFASPWWLSRPPAELARALPRELLQRATGGGTGERPPGRRDQYYLERARYYPEGQATLQF